jgi:hypothetical protein
MAVSGQVAEESMQAIIRQVVLALALVPGGAAQAIERLNVTWTPVVGGVVRFLGVEVGAPADGERIVSLRYELLKPCAAFSLSGHSLDKDGAKLARFELASRRSDTTAGQTFRDTVTVTYAPGHSLVVDEVSCQP